MEFISPERWSQPNKPLARRSQTLNVKETLNAESHGGRLCLACIVNLQKQFASLQLVCLRSVAYKVITASQTLRVVQR